MLLKKIFCFISLSLSLCLQAKTILVKNADELKAANKQALPGDVIILANGEWKDITISLNCTGTKEQPVIFRAQTAGKVLITGTSKLQLGGSYIVADGFYFTRGFAGNDAVIKFRVNKDQLANNCRITNMVINDFNNPKRMDDNNWVLLYGKNNRVDHCSFLNKKNMGVLLAVILDDARSRENFHSIDHNYFGLRLPLASNTGETIRVGVSQHCEFNSNTQIVDNFFEHCDGETEIISIKSGSNYIGNNLFKECQGSVVLRHGDFNTVENNIFLGNGKDGTGGVRVINKGQWVVNNLFFKCRGTGFRSPLAIMNGVPNSPAFRYVAVTEAVIANNSFVECSPVGLGIGSDTERTMPPKAVYFADNIFYNEKDSKIYNVFDDISGISFLGNVVSPVRNRKLMEGFYESDLQKVLVDDITMPFPYRSMTARTIPDSLLAVSASRLKGKLTDRDGFDGKARYLNIKQNAKTNCGAAWFKGLKPSTPSQVRSLNCPTAESISIALSKNMGTRLLINLTGSAYNFTDALLIDHDVTFTSNNKNIIKFTAANNAFLLQLKAGNSLAFKGLKLDLSGVNDFITTDTSGSSNHSNISMHNTAFSNLKGSFFTAATASIVDSMIINNCRFTNNKGRIFNFTNETANKGLYNVEKLIMSKNTFQNCSGQLLAMLRGGNDESTLGPHLVFSGNRLENCVTQNETALIHLFGTQRSEIEGNTFINCNPGSTLVKFEDLVSAAHLLKNNSMTGSGKVAVNKFVAATGNKDQ